MSAPLSRRVSPKGGLCEGKLRRLAGQTPRSGKKSGRQDMNVESPHLLRPVELLVGVRSIAGFLRVSQRKVLEMQSRGAPISRDETGVVRAEKAELWHWWKNH